MFQIVVVALCLVNSVAAYAAPCTCDGFSFLSRTGGENPCGCNFVKSTPRDELTAKTNGQLEKMASGLQAEVDELQSTLDGYQEGNSKKIKGLKKKLGASEEQKKKQAGDEKSALKERTKVIDDLKKQIEDDQAEIADISEEVKTNQGILKDVRLSIALREEDIHACACEKKAALMSKHVEPEEDKVDYDLVFKIEKLERKKAELSKDITKEQGTFGQKSRYLMNRNDAQQVKIEVEANNNIKYKKLDEARLDSVIAQKENIKRVLERKTAQLKQSEKDAAEAQKHYDNLEAEMKYCGCDPPSDTVLEMRKFKLDNR